MAELMKQAEALLKEVEAARYLSVSPEFLQGDRWRGASIPFIRVGRRGVRYRQSDLDKYIESRVQGVKA